MAHEQTGKGAPTLKLAIHGAFGRMGGAVTQQALAMPQVQLVALYERPEHPNQGSTDLRTGLPLRRFDAPEASLDGADLVIDFSSPTALAEMLNQWGDRKSALVSGTTGIDDKTKTALAELGKRTPVLWAPNMSLGIVVMQTLVERAASMLGNDYDAEVIEMHHRHKKDAPSGTALALVKALQRARPELTPVTGREGNCGPRQPNEVGLMAIRGGDIVGEHEVILAGPGESLRLKHIASSREVFASGALRFGGWLVAQQPGLYGAADWAKSVC